MEFRTLKLLKFTDTVPVAGLSTHNLKTHGVGAIAVTEISVVHIATACQKLDLISYCLSTDEISHFLT
jgi:hypothetical protein